LLFTWPIWRPPLGADTVATVLGLAGLYRDDPPRNELAARGIVEVYRARRIGGYYRNFAPAVACWGMIPVADRPTQPASMPSEALTR
jgi:hypothetical protein